MVIKIKLQKIFGVNSHCIESLKWCDCWANCGPFTNHFIKLPLFYYVHSRIRAKPSSIYTAI